MKTVQELIDYFSGKGFKYVKGAAVMSQTISGGKNIYEASSNELSFVSVKLKNEFATLINSSKSPLIVIYSELYPASGIPGLYSHLILSDSPKDTMIDCLTEFFLEKKKNGISKNAIIAEDTKIGNNISIGANVVIEEDVIIGNGCTIEPNVFIQSGCRIGNNVVIKAGAVIGGKGFGFVQNEKKEWKNFPHFGRVILEDNVEIGSNSCIDRGALSDTVLKKGVKVDNLVHIAHNVVIGQNSLIIANAMIGGSVQIKENVWLSPSVSVKNGLTIGSNTVLGMGAVVLKNVDDGTTVVGNPASILIKKKTEE